MPTRDANGKAIMTGMEAIRGTQEDCELLAAEPRVATRVALGLVAESNSCISTNWNLVRK